MSKSQSASASKRRAFSARETEWLQELDGIELASFRRRAFAFLIDWALLAVAILALLLLGTLLSLKISRWQGHSTPAQMNARLRPENLAVIKSAEAEKGKEQGNNLASEAADIAIPILYFGVLTWFGRGRTPGKRLMKIRVVSLVHRNLTFWHSVERALGYGAAALEGGFGFAQYFIHPYHRCVQDRIAETIVVTECSYNELQSRISHALLPNKSVLPVGQHMDTSLRSEEKLPPNA